MSRDHPGHRGQTDPDRQASERDRDAAACGRYPRSTGASRREAEAEAEEQRETTGQGEADSCRQAQGEARRQASTEVEGQAEAAPVVGSREGGDRQAHEGVLGETAEGPGVAPGGGWWLALTRRGTWAGPRGGDYSTSIEWRGGCTCSLRSPVRTFRVLRARECSPGAGGAWRARRRGGEDRYAPRRSRATHSHNPARLILMLGAH